MARKIINIYGVSQPVEAWVDPLTGRARVYLNLVIVRTGLPDPAKIALCLLPTLIGLVYVCGVPGSAQP